jgi:Na+/melibiose symporter-like transporter
MGFSAGGSEFRPLDYVRITIFGLAMTALWSSLHSIILPLRIADYIPQTQQATYLGWLTFSGLLLAILIQPIAGLISDHSGYRWGRRRPYILFGAILTLAFLPGIGLVGSWPALFAIYYLLQASANTALGPYLAFIPDLVPKENRGQAAGVKGLLDIVGGVVFVWLVGQLMGNYSLGAESRWLWLSLGVLAAVFLGTMLATIFTVKEEAGPGGTRPALRSMLRSSFRIDVKASPGYVPFLVCRLLFVMPLTTLQVFGLFFFRDVAGVVNPAAVVGNFILYAGIAMLATVYLAGRLSDRFGRRPIGLTSGIIGALGIGLLFFLDRSSLVLPAAAVLMGVGFGGLTSSNWALAVDVVPKDEAGKYIGLTNLATAGGSALARLHGPMIDFFNARSFGLGYTAMLLSSFSSIIVSSALLWRIKKR